MKFNIDEVTGAIACALIAVLSVLLIGMGYLGAAKILIVVGLVLMVATIVKRWLK